nr:sodium-independent sulfate anion transporter-like [Leptinotarsa decemlineata]
MFGSIKDITIGPTALMALMTYQQVIDRNVDYAILLCFLSGIVQIVMAVLHLGVLIDFISIPVTVGFTSATSVIIGTSQLKSLLGLKIKASTFLETITEVSHKIHETRMADLGLGVSCIVVLMSLRKLKDVRLHKKNTKLTKNQSILKYTLWLTSTSRNAIVVIFCSFLAYLYESRGIGSPFLVTGQVKPGLPEFKPPPFQTSLNNHTVSFGGMISDLGSSIVLVPVIAVLGNVAIAKAFASGSTIDATQELLTLSLCNIFGSFFSSMPITGSFSRSAVNHASGVQTPFGGITHDGKEYIMITPENSLYFPSIDFIKTNVGKAGETSKHLPVVIDCRYILGADFTAAKGISSLINEFIMRKQPLFFLNVRKEVVSIFQEIIREDFKYFNSKEELEKIIEDLCSVDCELENLLDPDNADLHRRNFDSKEETNNFVV